MRIITHLYEGHEQLAFLVEGNLYNTDILHPDLPISMSMLLNYWEDLMPLARATEQKIKNGLVRSVLAIPFENANILAPVPTPTSYRNGYSFRQHAEAVQRDRSLEMIPEFDQYPVFYFGNHNSIQGPGDIFCMEDHFNKLDFELQAAIVISKPGRNITVAEAEEYIGGLMIMNNISARHLQMEEMKLNLGPAKGKDFATAIGPMLVTADELSQFEVPCKNNHTGKSWNLPMNCYVNGIPVSKGNLSEMDWTFAEIIERCSYGVNLFAGDIIGSGAVGSGCFLEINDTGKLNDPGYEEQWLKENDVVELEIEGLGRLSNTIIKEDSDLSILALKKNI